MSWRKRTIDNVDPMIFGAATIKKWDSLVYEESNSEFTLEKILRNGKIVVKGDYFWQVVLYQHGSTPFMVCESGLLKSKEYIVGVINVIVATHADDSAMTIEELQESLYQCEDDNWNQYMAQEIKEADLSSFSWASIWPNPNKYGVNPSPCWGKYNFSIGWGRMSGWHVDIRQGSYGITNQFKSLKECVEYAKTKCNEASLSFK